MQKTEIREQFAGKKITLMGLGLLGRGLGLVRFLHSLGARLTVTDLKTADQLAPALESLSDLDGIDYVLGQHRLADFRTADMIIRAPNVPLDSEFIQEARDHKIPVKMDASLFVELIPSDIFVVGVTGTRGKSTVTHFIYEGLVNDGRRVHLGGNVRGMATLPLLEKVRSGDLVVLELDSWQLQGFGESKISPQLAVFTNLFRDHMNYYRGDMDQYFKDKANIFRYQSEADKLIVGQDLLPQVKALNPRSEVESVAEADWPADWPLALIGSHNIFNAALAKKALSTLEVSDQVIGSTAQSFTGLPGRLQYLGQKKGVHFYNDNNSTSPEAVLVAVEAVADQKGETVLIGGGADKDLDYSSFLQTIPSKIKKLILLPGEASVKIKSGWPESDKLIEVSSLAEAVAVALSEVQSGDRVLFSPGAASFGLFTNEYERGDLFIELFKQI